MSTENDAMTRTVHITVHVTVPLTVPDHSSPEYLQALQREVEEAVLRYRGEPPPGALVPA